MRVPTTKTIKTIRIGRLRKVPTSWLRQTLGIDEQAA
jgi:hypothetical protein